MIFLPPTLFHNKAAMRDDLQAVERLFIELTLVSLEEAKGMLSGDLPITPKITKRIGCFKTFFTPLQWCYAYSDFLDNIVPLCDDSRTTPAAIMPYTIYFIQEWMFRLKLSKEELYKLYQGEISVTPQIDLTLSLLSGKAKGRFLHAQRLYDHRRSIKAKTFH